MQYWIANNGQKEGPMSLDDIKARHLERKTLIWYPGLDKWTHADQIPELRTLFDYLPPELPGDDEPYAAPQPEIQNPEPAQEPVQPQPQPQPQQEQTYGTTGGSYTGGNTTGAFGSYQEVPQCPPSYLALSIISIICCCVPLGIVSLIYSAQVRSVYNQGEYEKAEKYSKNALYWGIGAIAIGIISSLIYSIIYVLPIL